MENEEIFLVAGLLNATGRMLYWKTNINVDIGDYAVVKNGSGYDLIKIVGIVKTLKNSAGRFSNTAYENMKEVIKMINLEEEK